MKNLRRKNYWYMTKKITFPLISLVIKLEVNFMQSFYEHAHFMVLT